MSTGRRFESRGRRERVRPILAAVSTAAATRRAIRRRPSLGHVSALDGVRALAVAAVVLYHGGVPVARRVPWRRRLLRAVGLPHHLAAPDGVRARPAGFGFRRFYERRARRLLPALVRARCAGVASTRTLVGPARELPVAAPARSSARWPTSGTGRSSPAHATYFIHGAPALAARSTPGRSRSRSSSTSCGRCPPGRVDGSPAAATSLAAVLRPRARSRVQRSPRRFSEQAPGSTRLYFATQTHATTMLARRSGRVRAAARATRPTDERPSAVAPRAVARAGNVVGGRSRGRSSSRRSSIVGGTGSRCSTAGLPGRSAPSSPWRSAPPSPCPTAGRVAGALARAGRRRRSDLLRDLPVPLPAVPLARRRAHRALAARRCSRCASRSTLVVADGVVRVRRAARSGERQALRGAARARRRRRGVRRGRACSRHASPRRPRSVPFADRVARRNFVRQRATRARRRRCSSSATRWPRRSASAWTTRLARTPHVYFAVNGDRGLLARRRRLRSRTSSVRTAAPVQRPRAARAGPRAGRATGPATAHPRSRWSSSASTSSTTASTVAGSTSASRSSTACCATRLVRGRRRRSRRPGARRVPHHAVLRHGRADERGARGPRTTPSRVRRVQRDAAQRRREVPRRRPRRRPRRVGDPGRRLHAHDRIDRRALGRRRAPHLRRRRVRPAEAPADDRAARRDDPIARARSPALDAAAATADLRAR